VKQSKGRISMRGQARRLALCAALALATASGSMLTGTAAVSAATPSSVVDSGSGWTVTEVAGGYDVTLKLSTPLPVRNDVPELLADGNNLGPATESADGLSLSVTTSDTTVATAKAVTAQWSSGDPIDLGAPAATPNTVTPKTTPKPKAVVPGTGPTLSSDPTTTGPFAYKVADYNFGAQAMPLANIGGIRGEVQGRIYLPTGGGPHPLVIFLHGRHSSCYKIVSTTPTASGWPCPPGYGIIDSYAGYDGAGDALASNGYTVVSIGADAINSNDNQLAPDDGAVARGQEILDTLTWLQQANAGHTVSFHDAALNQTLNLDQALANGDDTTGTAPLPAGAINAADLVNSMDFSDIGIMGHSRGGEGAATATSLNAGLAHPWAIKSAFLLAPIDFTRATVPGVVTTTLLPYCDGDVSDQQGQHFYADSRNNTFGDNVLRSDIWVMGTDHDFYNQEWTPPVPSAADDWHASTDSVCGMDSPTTTRLAATQQFQVGSAYLAGFFELTLGNQTQFLPMFDGTQSEPPSVSTFADVRTVANQPSSMREDVTTFAKTSPLIGTSGTAVATVCANRDGRTVPVAAAFCTSGVASSSQQPYWTPASFAPNVPLNQMTHLTWSVTTPSSGPPTATGTLSVTIPPGQQNVSGYQEMTVNMSPDESVTGSTDMTVAVTDGKGHTWSSLLSALNPWTVTRMPGSTSTNLGPNGKLVLQQAHVPTAALAAVGLDLSDITNVSFTTVDPTTAGGEYFQDLAFDSKGLGTPSAQTLPTVNVASTNVDEGSGPHTDQVAVYLSQPASTAVTTYLTAVGSATGAVGLAMQPITFQPGETCHTVQVPVKGNSTPGATPSSSFKIAVSNPNDAVLGTNDFGAISVREDDGVTGTGTPLPPDGVQGDACAELNALSHPGTLSVSGSGNVGGSVTLAGSGYRSGESVNFTLDSVAVGSAIANGSGHVTLTAAVPATPAGSPGIYSAVGVGSRFTSTGSAPPVTPTNPTSGYWEVASDGGIFSFGNAGFFNSIGGSPLNAPVVGMASTPDRKGYWEVASDGGIFSFGNAGFYNSIGGSPLNAPIVGMASTPDGKGYWEVASDGGIFSFGDAGFFNSMGGTPLNAPIVGMASTPDGKGYWEVASDGGIFSFGDAGFFNSMGGTPLNAPIVGMAST
jgi:hypothetical protein